MVRWTSAFVRDERGQDLAEYAIALAVIAVGVGLIAASIGEDVETLWANAQPVLQTVIDGEP
jgi:Flp pilus assembly pilin Flp